MDKAKILPFGEKHCIIRVDYSEALSPHSFPGFAVWVDGTRDLRFRPTANNIKYIQQHWPDAEWDAKCQNHLINFINEQKAAEDFKALKHERIEDDGSYEYKTKPFDHQRHSFLLSRERKAFALFMEQGTGKSKVKIDKAGYLYSQGLIDTMIIIAPNGVHKNWAEIEIPVHMPDWIPHHAWAYNTKTTIAAKKAIEDVFAFEGLKILCFNVEGFTSPKAKAILERAVASGKCFVIIDESQYIKNHDANRTKYLTKECLFALDTTFGVHYKGIMTGTNVTKGVEDLYSQLLWLNPDILGFDTFTSFRSHFCTTLPIPGTRFGQRIVGYKNIDELIKMIDPHSFRVLKKDCLDLPEKLYKRWTVELTPQQRKLYNELAGEFITHMDGQSLTADFVITRLLRLQQIVCGWFPADDTDDMIAIKGDNPRLEAVRQHCTDTDGSILVWARFKNDISLLEDQLKKDHGNDNVLTYYGGTPEDDRMNNVNAFQDKKSKIMICSKAAARGLTLTACENPIYHSQEFDLEVRLQSEDRCHRIGTVNHVTYTDIEAKGTIDTQIINALRRKKHIADMVNQDPDSFFMGGL